MVKLSSKSIEKTARWPLEPFDKKIKLKGLIGRWLLFLVVGFVVMGSIQFFAKYDFSEADTLISETGEGCDTIAMLLLLLLPPVEELIFRIIPHRYIGIKASFIGSLVWAFLHIFGRNFAIVGFQLVMGIFYFKVVARGKYKEAIIFHEVFNLVPLFTCFTF